MTLLIQEKCVVYTYVANYWDNSGINRTVLLCSSKRNNICPLGKSFIFEYECITDVI